jgi:hypothetical protein
MATLQTVIQDVMARKGSIAIKRLSLKVGADLTQVLSGAMPPTTILETKVQAAMRELGF